MLSESARMSTAAEARFRIDAPNSKPRHVKVIALDPTSEALVKHLAERRWNSASFFTASAFAGAPPGRGFSVQGWLSDLAGRTKDLIDEVNGADLVVMVATVGDRKSTRLNSSHGYISYAVFCLKKKKLQIYFYLICNPQVAPLLHH